MTPDHQYLNGHEPRPLAVDAKTAAAMTNAGELPSFRMGRAVRYRVSTLEAWMVAREKGGPR